VAVFVCCCVCAYLCPCPGVNPQVPTVRFSLADMVLLAPRVAESPVQLCVMCCSSRAQSLTASQVCCQFVCVCVVCVCMSLWLRESESVCVYNHAWLHLAIVCSIFWKTHIHYSHTQPRALTHSDICRHTHKYTHLFRDKHRHIHTHIRTQAHAHTQRRQSRS
jgi:hypothetical protein